MKSRGLKIAVRQATRWLSLADRQRGLSSSLLANLTVVLTGFALANQPLASLAMTSRLRGSIIGIGAMLYGIALWLERFGARRSR